MTDEEMGNDLAFLNQLEKIAGLKLAGEARSHVLSMVGFARQWAAEMTTTSSAAAGSSVAPDDDAKSLCIETGDQALSGSRSRAATSLGSGGRPYSRPRLNSDEQEDPRISLMDNMLLTGAAAAMVTKDVAMEVTRVTRDVAGINSKSEIGGRWGQQCFLCMVVSEN